MLSSNEIHQNRAIFFPLLLTKSTSISHPECHCVCVCVFLVVAVMPSSAWKYYKWLLVCGQDDPFYPFSPNHISFFLLTQHDVQIERHLQPIAAAFILGRHEKFIGPHSSEEHSFALPAENTNSTCYIGVRK